MVCWSVCRSVTVVSPVKTAEPIKMLFGLKTQVDGGNHVLGGSAHWRHLTNTIEHPFVAAMWPVVKLLWSHTHTTVSRSFFRNYPGEQAPEEILLLDFMVQGKITEAETPTIRKSATPSGPISDPPPSYPIFMPDALPATTWLLYPGLGQAPNMLACIPSGVVYPVAWLPSAMVYPGLITCYNKNSSGDEIVNVNFYAVRPEATRIRWNNAKWRHYAVQGHSRFKIGTNRKVIYDFLLVINTNLPPIFVSDIAIFVLKRDVKLQLTNLLSCTFSEI